MLQFFDVNTDYVDWLKTIDKQIPNILYASHNKFVCGVILYIDGFSYYAPVSHNKKVYQTSFPIKDDGEVRQKDKVEFTCDKGHPNYIANLDNRLQGCGCPVCNQSKGEESIIKYITSHNIYYVPQKIFKDCKYVSLLKFDFYIPSQNIIIEYNGGQHYKAVDYFGGEEAFKKQKERDRIKRKYCKDNGIKLIVIPYTKFNHIDSILDIELQTITAA